MFRELQRKNKQLSHEECIRLLREEKRGVLSVLGDEGYPYGMPMNHFYHDGDGCIYFHCGKKGHRLDALRQNDKVSFCVYDEGYREDGDWALHIKSVIVFGRIRVLDDMSSISEITAQLSRKFTDDEAYIQNEIANFAGGTLLLQIVPEHICGKAVTES